MKKFKIITAVITMSLFITVDINAQQPEYGSETYLNLVIPSGPHAGEYFDALITFFDEEKFEIVTTPSWVLAEMNKSQLIDAIASGANMTKPEPRPVLTDKEQSQDNKGVRKEQYTRVTLYQENGKVKYYK